MAIASATVDERFSAAEIEEVRLLYHRTDRYQPVFGFEDKDVGDFVSRACLDRCKFFEREFTPDLKNISALDVGCSMGYISHYLASHGVRMVGIDRSKENIELCKHVATKLGLPASFMQQDFSEDFCSSMREGEFDVIFLFSVLHHIIPRLGVERVRKMMHGLLDKCDVIYAELARNSEDVRFDWKGRLPDDEREIFYGDDVKIELVGEFPALNGKVTRPLYRISKTKRVYNRLIHNNISLVRSGVKDGRLRGRKYTVSDSFFSKMITFFSEQQYVSFAREIYVANRFANVPGFPVLLGHEMRGKVGVITYARVAGVALIDVFRQRMPFDKGSVARQLAGLLSTFSAEGLYWNDCRAHNLMIQDGELIAVDLEYASPIQAENTLNVFLWLLYDITTGHSNSHEINIFKDGHINVSKPELSLEDYDASLRDIARLALGCKNIDEFAKKYSERKSLPLPPISAVIGV